MSKTKIKEIRLLNEDKPEEREILCELTNGTTIHITACYESWEQWGGTTDELWLTMPIAEKYNAWLHGENGF